MEAGMITTVLLVACATICIGVGIFYFFINNTKNKGRICILLLGIGGGIWALGSALYGNCTDDRLAQDFFCMTIVGFNLYVIAIVIYVACLTGVKIKGYGLMVGLGILTSLVDGVSFGSSGSAIFTGSMEEPVLPQNFMAACFITGCILCFAFCAASILYYIGRRKLCVKVRENMWHISFWEIQLCFFRQFRIRCCHFMELNLIPVRFMV